MSEKRGIKQTSPEDEITPKRPNKEEKLASMADIEKSLIGLIAAGTANLATKDDLQNSMAHLERELLLYKEESKQAKMQVEILTSKVVNLEQRAERMERQLKANNLIIEMPGRITADPIQLAQTSIQKLLPGSTQQPRNCRVITNREMKKVVVAEMASSADVQTCLRNSASLRGSDVFISRDLTDTEGQVRGALLKIRKYMKTVNNTNFTLRYPYFNIGDAGFKCMPKTRYNTSVAGTPIQEIFPDYSRFPEIMNEDISVIRNMTVIVKIPNRNTSGNEIVVKHMENSNETLNKQPKFHKT